MMVCFKVLGSNRREKLKCQACALYTGLHMLCKHYKKKEKYL